MQRPYIFNRHLKKHYEDEQNKFLSKRIKKAKSSIDFSCPESFTFFKTRFKEGSFKDKSITKLYNNYSKKT